MPEILTIQIFMKEFSKYVFATVTGLVIFGIIICVLSILSLAGMLASGTSETSVKDNTVMVLKLGSVSERAIDNPISAIMGQGTESTGLNDILSAIKKAADNNKIKGIYIEGNDLKVHLWVEVFPQCLLHCIRSRQGDDKPSRSAGMERSGRANHLL